jgi:hypothetical protein
MDLHRLEKGKVEIDTCFNCGGTWLDKGELEALIKEGHHGPGVMEAILNFVHRKTA